MGDNVGDKVGDRVGYSVGCNSFASLHSHSKHTSSESLDPFDLEPLDIRGPRLATQLPNFLLVLLPTISVALLVPPASPADDMVASLFFISLVVILLARQEMSSSCFHSAHTQPGFTQSLLDSLFPDLPFHPSLCQSSP